MHIAKWVGAGVGGLLALFALAALVLTQFVDPNRYKGPIERQVAAATGREFKLEGEIELSFFPWLALTTGAAELPAPAGFPDRHFLRWREAHVGVRLLPLLRGEFVVDRVRLVGLEARLSKAADGRVNWSFDTGAARPPTGRDAAASLPDIAGIELRDSRLVYSDATSGTRLQLNALGADVEPIRSGVPMRVRAEATVSRPGWPERIAVNLSSLVALGPPMKLSDTELSGKLLGGRFAARGVPWRFSAPRLSYDAASGAVAAPEWQLGFNDARLAGTLAAKLGGDASAEGEMTLAPVSLRETLAAAGVDLPPTRARDAWSRFGFGAGFRYAGDSFTIDPLTVRLDGTNLTGRVVRGEAGGGVIHFSLHADRMDLGRYLKPEGTPSEPFVFPAAMLKALRAEGALDIDEATLDGVRMKGVRLGAEP